MRRILENKTYRFVAVFILCYAVLYGINYAAIGLTSPGGSYSPFLHQHLDYVAAYRSLILKGGSLFVSICGYDNITNAYYLHVPALHHSVRMIYSCIGLDVVAFWWAFIIAWPQSLKRKAAWFIGGTTGITLLNMIRVGALAISNKAITRTVDHHTVFNIGIYIFIFLMITRVIKHTGKD